MTITDLKQEYRKQLAIIKNDANGITTKKQALDILTFTYDCILKEEPKSEIESPTVIFKRYIEKIDIPKVAWECSFDIGELDRLEDIRKLAYTWVRVNHPLENDQTDKFGQIVNARMNLIILSRQ